MNYQTQEIINQCHRLAWLAPGRGATQASITVTPDLVDYRDNAGTNQSWDASDAHPQAPYPLAHILEECNAPEGLNLQVIVHHQYPSGRTPSVKHINHDPAQTIAAGDTPDGTYHVTLYHADHFGNLIISNPDGTTHRHHVLMQLTRRTADPEDPELVIRHDYISVSATPRPAATTPATPEQVQHIVETAGDLFCQHLEDLNSQGTYAWTEYAYPFDNIPKFYHRLRHPPKHGLRLPRTDQDNKATLLGEHAVRLDAPYPAEGAIATAWQQQTPPPTRQLFSTSDEYLPTMRVEQVEVAEEDGSITIYPGPVNDLTRHEPDEPHAQPRFSRNRADNVAAITLHYTIYHPDGTRENGSMPCLAYTD